MIAHRYNVHSWYSYSGRIGDGLSATYKDRVHVSKQRHAVYKASCICGILSVGETDLNLKVRISEHKNATSVSSLSEHLRIGRRFDATAHKLDYNRTVSILHKKHSVRRKFLESLAIRFGPDALCNSGSSMNISEMWFGCTPSICTAFADIG